MKRYPGAKFGIPVRIKALPTYAMSIRISRILLRKVHIAKLILQPKRIQVTLHGNL